MPQSDFEFDVFLAYAAKDKDVARSIAKRLRKDGIRVWFDTSDSKPDGNVEEKIEFGLEHSRALVLCMSVNAFGSNWAQLVAGTLRFRDPLNKERRFIPLRLDDTPTPALFIQFLFIEWHPTVSDEAYTRLLGACRPPIRTKPSGANAASGRYSKKIIQLGQKLHSNFCGLSPNGKYALTGRSIEEDHDILMWEVKTGRCLRELKGHTRMVWNVAWSPDGRRALSGSSDNTIRLWDMETGHCIRVLEGHKESVWGIAWSTDQRQVISGSYDNSIRLWDVDSGHCLRVLKGHTGGVYNVTFSADARRALTGSSDHTIRLWDLQTGECLRVLEGHTEGIECLAWSDNQRHALTGAHDRTMRLWDVETGRTLRVFEGHTQRFYSLAWSADQRRALSGSSDNTVRLWDVETGRCICVLEGHGSAVQGLMWSDDGRHLVSVDSRGEVREWNLERFYETGSREAPFGIFPMASDQVQYTNAKVLLVGDTGVGKSALAERLIQKKFVPTKSSHARKAHLLKSDVVNQPDGVLLHRETMLWDLAGQPAYRLVHQLSMEDAALACVLIDNRSEINPFEGAAYWSHALDQSRTNAKLKKLLVASRMDVGGLPASPERIQVFANENGFAHFIPTSANTGEGCSKLLEAISEEIQWEDLPKITTTTTLAAMRDYVAKLKGEQGNEGANGEQHSSSATLLTVAVLHEGFVAYFGEKISLDEFISHLQRLEATDSIDLLVYRTTGAEPRSETLVLLDPTRVDAYASALLVAAKDEPDGPGHLLESRVREGRFKLSDDERMANYEGEGHVLWFVMENLLSRDLALREQIGDSNYIVFPSQCTAELTFPGVAAFGVAFGFAGPVRSIYATLIAQLAHYAGFKQREFFHDAAAYRAENGGRCIVRLRDQGRGYGELEISFENETSTSVRLGFLEFVGKHLESKSTPGSVTRRHAYQCANEACRNPFEDRVVKARLAVKKKDLVCPVCEKKTPLVDLLASPSAAAESVAERIDIDARVGRQRMTAALVVRAKEAEGKFDVFLSHNSKDKAAVEKIAKRLLSVGIRPWLDKWNLVPGETVSSALEQAIETIPCAALCFGPADKGKWHIMEIRAYVEQWANKTARMIPVILPRVDEPPTLPLFVRQTLWVDMRDWEHAESDSFYRLVCGITGKAPGDSPLAKFGVRDVAKWQRTTK